MILQGALEVVLPREPESALLRARLSFEMPHVLQARVADPAEIAAEEWDDPAARLLDFDRRIHSREDAVRETGGRVGVFVRCFDARTAWSTLHQVLRRYQRLFTVRTKSSRDQNALERILDRHASLHDCRKPLVRADYDHALDVWQWLLHLQPAASLALQTAALFHDIERLLSESERRVEHRSADYVAFKMRHARLGSVLLATELAELGLHSELAHAVTLVANHEQRTDDEDSKLLNDADALSFFSLNSSGFLAYFGAQHTRKKVAYTLRRMGPRARALLREVRLEESIATLVRELQDETNADYA